MAGKYIGTGLTVSIIGLITWFVLSSHFVVQLPGNYFCFGTYEDPCEAQFNITLTDLGSFYIWNKNAIELSFEPDVKAYYYCKRDGRFTSKNRANRELYPCGIGWREFDWKTPLTSKYSYIEKFTKNKKHEYKIVVFKHNPTDIIKWGGTITSTEFDPLFIGFEYIYENLTRTFSVYEEKVVRIPTICHVNSSCTSAYDETTIIRNGSRIEYYNGAKIGVRVNKTIYMGNVNVEDTTLSIWKYNQGDRNFEEYGICRDFEIDKGLCSKVRLQ